MHLFDLDEYGTRFGIDMTVTDFFNAVSEASKAATSTLASRFRFGDFAPYTARRDFFEVDRMFGTGRTLNRSFSLARGFVTSGTVTAYYASSPLDLRNGDLADMVDLSDTEEDGESDHLIIDYDKGLLSVYGVELENQWVLVDYSGGFDTNSSEEYEGVPAWLSDAAMAQTALNLRFNRAFVSEDAIEDFDELKMAVSTHFSTQARTHLNAIKPVASEVGT